MNKKKEQTSMYHQLNVLKIHFITFEKNCLSKLFFKQNTFKERKGKTSKNKKGWKTVSE